MSDSHPRLSRYEGTRVFVTGHTGFKGAWLVTWLHALGANVTGFATAPPARGAFHDLGVAGIGEWVSGDVRDARAVDDAVATARPDLVFHLAAQPLVRLSWADRRSTFATNVMGTVNVLEASLAADSVKGVVCITTDKVYENTETGEPFAETDRLGGHDPYSASKAAAELAINPYRSGELMGFAAVPVVSARAGNVIGGGDWSADRLIPDIVRALEAGTKVVLRRPDAVRPWQHVLDCLYGYLLLGVSMLEAKPLAPAYNFAHDGGAATVIDVARAVVRSWGASEDELVIEREDNAAEAGLLTLNPALARRDLGWEPAWTLVETIAATVRFYQDASIGPAQIQEHMRITARHA
ncbi:MAG TPA: CDP-glucose 4,6-dehydratase [Acidimicrobiales bacterium]|nr:CDP-glucose 4,6-dehydratase [Acidimicrobiales bacterium]